MTPPSQSKFHRTPRQCARRAEPAPRPAVSQGPRVRVHVDPALFHLVARSPDARGETDGHARIDPRRMQALRETAVRAIREAGRGTAIFLLAFRHAGLALVLSAREGDAGLEITVSPAPPGLKVTCITEADARRLRPEPAPARRLPGRLHARW